MPGRYEEFAGAFRRGMEEIGRFYLGEPCIVSDKAFQYRSQVCATK